jgi:AsmA protein
MIWIKRLAIALLGLVLLLAAAVAVFVASFDVNRYKPTAIEWMKTEHQRSLAIDGPIELSVFPRLALKVSKLRLSEHGRAETFASVDEASLALELLPLLRRQVVVDRVAARGLRAVLTRDAKGVRNIDDLLARSREPASPSTRSSGPAMQFDVGGVSLEDAQLTLRDEMGPLAGTLHIASFTSGRLTPGLETPLALKARLELQQPQALALDVEGKTALSFDPERGSAALRGADLKLGGRTVALGNLAATLEAKRLAYSPATRTIELDALKLALSGRQGASPFELALDWPQLAVTGERLQGSGFSGRFTRDGQTALKGRFESGPPGGNFEAMRLPGFTLKAEGRAGPRKIDAELKSNLLLQPERKSLGFERLDLRAKLDEPGAAPLQLAVAGTAGVGSSGGQWSLQGALNTNRFETQGSAAFGKSVPAIQASARFDKLDLNQLLAPGAAKPAAPAGPAPADTPVALDGLTAVNGRFGLTAGQLTFRQYKVADAKLDATLEAGLLRITRLSGAAWGGQIEASGSAEAKAKRLALRLVASGVNVNALLKDVAAKDLLEGTGRVNADLTSSGANVAALRANLAGNAAVQLRDGAVKGVNLARSMRQAKAALSMQQDALAKAQATEKTDFSELTASARIANGVAESQDLDLKSPYLRIGGAGRFDIGRGRIDYTARATVTGAPTGQDGAELAALRGVTVPVQLSGPFEAIDWKIQWSGVAAAAVEKKLKEKLADELGAKLGRPPPAGAAASAPTKPKDQLKETLKGLFKK